MTTVVIAAGAPQVARILEHKLRREGHDVLCVHDANAMRNALTEREVDVLITDVSLRPVLDTTSPRAGWLLMVDSLDPPESAHAAMRDGAAGIVRLPFKPTAVAAQVATLMSLATA
ncbi:MAG: hypothetical protein JOZ92_08825 [Candidatus Dormibacteraeota bacterium]|nr:hypothetical protein [Candidatus Dormibacteraeota bacterium]